MKLLNEKFILLTDTWNHVNENYLELHANRLILCATSGDRLILTWNIKMLLRAIF